MGDERPIAGSSTTARRVATAQLVTQTQIYRPGLALAAALMLSPALLSLVVTGMSLLVYQAVPLVVPAILLLVLPALSLVWFAFASVRTSATGIGTVRLFRPWRDMPWALIERARRRGPLVILRSSTGQRIAFIPLLLRDGTRLYRELLVRLPAHVLDARMGAASRRLLGERVVATAQGGLTGSVNARPRVAWRTTALALAFIILSAGVSCVIWLRAPLSAGLGILSLAGVLLALGMWRWCSQQLDVSHDGIQVTFPLARSSQRMTWSEIEMIEHTPAERLIRLRGNKKLVCAGPTMLRPTDRDVVRAFLHANCISRGVPVVQRRWLV